MKLLHSIIAALAAFILMAPAAASQDIIPKPQKIEMGSGCFRVDSETKLYTNLKGSDRTLMESYIKSLPYDFEKGRAKDESNVIRLILGQLQGTQNYEAYTLEVTPDKIEIKSGSSAGLFNGMQTMLQLGGGSLEVPCAKVEDEPRFHYRGYLLDVSRHFFPKEFVMKMLDALAYYKINVFHFHLEDSGGWRVEIKKYPDLVRKTAYRPKSDLHEWWAYNHNGFCSKETPGAYGGYYTQDDIREIVAYAAARHIEVIPEIDMPGHSKVSVWAYPELACEGKDSTNTDVLCIGKEKTFEFCEDVLTEIMELFPSKYIHIGGDEAARDTWKDCELCQKRMKDEHIEDVAELQAYFTRRIQDFLTEHGKTAIGWDEIVDGETNSNTVVTSWRDNYSNGTQALQKGFRVIECPTSKCYLDYYQDSPFYEPNALSGYTPLKNTYNFDPAPEGIPNRSLVLGVQGNLWTEWIYTEEHAEYMTFPRMLAVAEDGWTANELKSYPDFKERVIKALAYLRDVRGIASFDITKEFGSRPEHLRPVINDAIGKGIYHGEEQSKEYPEARCLIDGKAGDWYSEDGHWLFMNNGMDVMVDMGEARTLKAVKACFMKMLNAGVYLPEDLEILISEDGRNFRSIYTRHYEQNYVDNYKLDYIGWTGLEKGRYVRFKANFPHWGFILCDELVIL